MSPLLTQSGHRSSCFSPVTKSRFAGLRWRALELADGGVRFCCSDFAGAGSCESLARTSQLQHLFLFPPLPCQPRHSDSGSDRFTLVSHSSAMGTTIIVPYTCTAIQMR